METALTADFAFLRAHQADTAGNLIYRRTARNFNPPFATAATVTIAEVDDILEPGQLDPEAVATPGIFVNRLVQREKLLERDEVFAFMRTLGRNVKISSKATGQSNGLTPELMALRAAQLVESGQYVNLGIGMPTLVSDFIADDVTLHAEDGVLDYGPLAADGEEDVDLYNASSQLVTLQSGASFFHSADAFAMARGGHLDTVILGGFQVAENGDLANWKAPHMSAGSVGGAMDLAAGTQNLIVVMNHTTKEGESKLLPTCTYPLTARACVTWIVTNLALIQVTAQGFVLKECAPGVTLDSVQAATAATLSIADDVKEMDF